MEAALQFDYPPTTATPAYERPRRQCRRRTSTTCRPSCRCVRPINRDALHEAAVPDVEAARSSKAIGHTSRHPGRPALESAATAA